MSCRRVADDGAAGDSNDEKDDRSVSANYDVGDLELI